MKWHALVLLLCAVAPATAREVVPPTKHCFSCAAWNVDQKPFKVFGNTYYVGTHELSSILVVSNQGSILIDGDLAESAPLIANHIRELGFDPKSIKLLLNSHAHFDHAGGLAWLQKQSGARIALSPWSAKALSTGRDPLDDPQVDLHEPAIAPLTNVEIINDGQTVHVGNVALKAYFTPGHTPGGTSWRWTSCEGAQCRSIIYADSLTAVAAPKYRFTDHPDLLAGFEKSFTTLETIPCGILLSPHPGFAHTLDALKARDAGNPAAFMDSQACQRYVAAAREKLEKRLTAERAGIRDGLAQNGASESTTATP